LEADANAAMLVSPWDTAASLEEGDTSTSLLVALITLEEAPQLMWIMLPLPAIEATQEHKVSSAAPEHPTVAQAPHHPETAQKPLTQALC